MSKSPVFKRVLLKLSGEALRGREGYGIDPAVVNSVALEIKGIRKLGVQVGIVIGGGNLFRGLSASQQGMDRVIADNMGMLATVINGLALQDALEKISVPTRVLTAIEMKAVAEPFIRRRAIRHLEKKRVIVLAGGTGNPYFTTDTTAALRATEIRAEVLLKATKVDGVYDSDPTKNGKAKKYKKLDYMTILKKSLKVMDSTAASLCMENHIPIIVFNMTQKGNIKKIITGSRVGTLVS